MPLQHSIGGSAPQAKQRSNIELIFKNNTVYKHSIVLFLLDKSNIIIMSEFYKY